MDIGSDDAAKRLLDITDWRNLSKEKFLQFVAMVPDMDKEVRMKLIEQLPEVMRLAAETTTGLGKVHDSTLSSNDKSQDQVHEAWREIRVTIAAQLERDDLGSDERKALNEQLIQTGERQAEADSKNKTYLDRWDNRKTFSIFAAAVILTTLAVGGKTAFQNGSLVRR